VFAASGEANCRQYGAMGSVSRRSIGGSIHRIREFELEKVRFNVYAFSQFYIFIFAGKMQCKHKD
jgi:hypothetical protein